MPLFHMVPGAPAPVAPFSHAVEADGWLVLSGQMPTDPDAPDAPLPEGVEAQTERVIDNLAVVLGGLGLGLGDVVGCRCYLTRFERDYAAFNAVWARRFPEGSRPARTTIGVTGLAVGALVEVEALVRRP